ncbi:MAG TPA: amidohydrolase family protein [Stellaceae bacterium]|nr:amidohydrolase family protein [Stellaceae bacterium]
MSRTYDVIDADGHVLEPFTLWNDYLDPAYRDRAPKLVKDQNGKERLLLEEKILGSTAGFGGIGGIGARQGVVSADAMEYKDGRKGGFDPHARIPDMDLDGIDAAFLYPSLGLFAGAVRDPGFAAAMCRAYNRWLADYCKPYPDRLFGVAMLPMQSVEAAIEEMRFARTELGFRGGFLRPNPYNDRKLHDPAYEPFWRAAEELDFSIGLHEGGNSGMPTVGIDRFDGRGAQHIISHTMEMMLACMSMIWGGVVERHPKLRIGFLESGGGWIAPWLDRMDRHFDDKGFNDSGLTMRPSELFERNCWISFEPVEGSIRVLADYIGPHKILWATDYPHRDGFFPGAPAMIAERLAGLSLEAKHQIMAGGAMKFYGLI